MTAFNGYIEDGAILTSTPSNPDLGGKDTNGFVDAWAGAWDIAIGSQTDTQPTDMPGDAQTGGRALTFGYLDFFNRIHIQYQALDLGNLISTQTVEFTVFSTFFEGRILNSITPTNADGLTLTPPLGETYPQPYAPWEERQYVLQIDVDGPPTIDASYLWDFDNRDYTMTVTGRRVVTWFIPPNWRSPVVERIEFSTNIITAFDGSEQRLARRGDSARWFLEYRWDAVENDARYIENTIFGWGPRIWAVPIWQHGQNIGSNLVPGATSILADTADLDFHVGGLAVLMNPENPTVFEAFEVLEVNPTSITPKRPTTGSWPASSTYIYPARTARMTQYPQMTRWTSQVLSGAVSWRMEEPLRRTAASETTYRSYPILEQKPEWSTDPQATYERKMATLDFTFSAPFIDDESGLAEPAFVQRWFFTTRAEVEAFRQFLFARRGKQKAIWIPSFADDLEVVTTVSAAQINLDVRACGLTSLVAGEVHKRDLRIQMTDGTVFYRRASAYVEVDATTERLTIDSALGAVYEPGDFALISWMSLMRLDSDSIEITHQTGQYSGSVTGFRAPRNVA